MYSVVQTGAKIQFGGLNDGFTSPAYQEARFGYVASCPNAEAAITGITAIEALSSGAGRCGLS